MNSKTFKINYKEKELETSANYKESGKEVIIFIHGLGCAKESFDAAFDFPKFNDFSLLAIDLVGFGDSSKPQDFTYTMEVQAEICKLLLDELNPKRVHIVAHSMGGAIGLLLAEKLSNKLISFTNIEGNLISEDCGLLSRKTISVSFEEFRKSVFAELKSETKESNNKSSNLWLEWNEKSNTLAFYSSSESLVKWSDSRKLLTKFKNLKTKKVYFYGDKNSEIKVLNELGNIRKIEISNSGHFVMNDNPEQFYTRLGDFIGGRAN